MKPAVIVFTAVMLVTALPVYGQLENGDVDCSGSINILDVTYTVNYLYKEGPEPCPFTSSGVNYVHYDSRTVNVGASFEDLIGVAIDAPADGWVAVDFSFYVYTEAYCMQFSLNYPSEPRAQSLILSYTVDAPTSWHQVFPVDSGFNYFDVDVMGCIREGDTEKYDVTFRNVNMSLTYFPMSYPVIRK